MVVTVWVAVASVAAVTVALVMVGVAAMEALVTVGAVASGAAGMEVATMVEIMGAAMPAARKENMVRAAKVEAGTKAAVAGTLA